MKTILITDSDFGATDKNFEYLLAFQPSFGAMIIWDDSIEIFLDPRYFEKTKTIDAKSICEKLQNNSDIKYNPEKIIYVLIDNNIIQLLSEKIKNSNIQNNSIKSKKCVAKEWYSVSISDNISVKYYEQLKKHPYLQDMAFNIVENIFSQHRQIKTSREIENIKKAIHVIDEVFLYIESLNAQWELIWMKESEVRWIIISQIMKHWWSWESFDAIVAFWENSASPHHFAWNTVIEEWVLLIDMWAVYEWYCSDFTRTFWVQNKGESDPRCAWLKTEFETVYKVVKDAHERAYNNTEVWMTWADVDRLSREYIENCWYWKYFTHSTGHWIGLDVHELPWISKNKTNILKDQTVFTIEPWIYLPGKFGIRIEDIVFMNNGKLEKATNIAI